MQEFNKHPFWRQFLVLFFLFVCCWIGFSVLSLIWVKLKFGVEYYQRMLLHPEQYMQYINDLKTIQLLVSIGAFIVPAVYFSWLKTGNTLSYLEANSSVKPVGILLGGLLLVSALPLLSVLIDWNAHLHFPKIIQGYITESEEQAEKITRAFLTVQSPLGLLFNIVVIALVPAIAEEFFFRGALQKLLTEWTKNAHVAIFITGLIFSFVHFQFLGFVPRLVLGMLLGYLFYWGKSIWINVFAHFTNNAIQVVLYYCYLKQMTSFNPDQTESFGTSLIIGSTVVFAGLCLLFKRYTSTPQAELD